MPVSMTDDEDAINEINALDADDRALAIHEAGHAVVARALGAEVVCVEIDVRTGNGGSRSSVFADNIKNLAVCVAGRKAEHAFAALALRSTRTAAENLTANADVVHRIADELLAREHIEGEELAGLLAAVDSA